MLAGRVALVRRGAEHALDVFEDMLGVNLTGTMRCCTLAHAKVAAAAAAAGGGYLIA